MTEDERRKIEERLADSWQSADRWRLNAKFTPEDARALIAEVRAWHTWLGGRIAPPLTAARLSPSDLAAARELERRDNERGDLPPLDKATLAAVQELERRNRAESTVRVRIYQSGFSAAQERFKEVAAKAEAGDADAIADLPAVAAAYLKAARD